MAKRTTLMADVLFPRLPSGRRLPVTEILHLSASADLDRLWARLVSSLCWRDRSVGVLCTESFFPAWKPSGRRIRQTFRVYNRGGLPMHAIDKLYSEAVLLP